MTSVDQATLDLPDDSVPAGWVLARLGDGLLTDVQPGFACGTNSREPSGVPHLRPMNVSREGRISLSDVKFVPVSAVQRERQWLQHGDVLFNNTNSAELVGKTAFYDLDQPRAFSNHMTRLRCREDRLDPRFCAKVLHYLWQAGHFESVCSHHVSQASVGRSVLLDTAIPLPPVPEQQRIIAKIEELLAHVNAARGHLTRVPAILRRFRESVLAAACSGRLTEDWRARTALAETGMDLAVATHTARAERAARAKQGTIGHWFPRLPGPADVAEPEDPLLPQTWASCPISTLFWVETGATPLRSRSDYYQGGTVPWVKTGEVQNRDITAAEACITALALRETNVKVLPRGTILVAMYGEGRTRGQVGRLRIEAATNQACAALVNPWLNPVIADYAYLFCMSQYEAIRSEAVGGSQPNLSLGVIKQWRVNVPPLAEQHEIVRRVGALFALAGAIEQRVATAAARADRLTQAILAKAFRGELVPTDAELQRAGASRC